MKAAAAAGLLVIGVNPGMRPDEMKDNGADVTFGSIEEILQFVRSDDA